MGIELNFGSNFGSNFRCTAFDGPMIAFPSKSD
jgi:hypothetical protein